MPVVKSPRGGRSPYAQAKVSAAISAAYQLVYGRQISRYRKHIQEHTQRISATLKETLGDGARTEWSRAAILDAIHTELRDQASAAVYETFSQDHPLPSRGVQGEVEWDRMEPRPDPEELEAYSDPVWTVLGVKPISAAEVVREENSLDSLGIAVTRLAKIKPKRVRTPSVRRSAWIAFWTRLASEEGCDMDVSFLVERARGYTDQRSLTPEGWWDFWCDLLYRSFQDDPRLVNLLRAIRYRKQLTALTGVSWLANSEVSPEHTALLTDQAPSLLKKMWLAHLRLLGRSGRLRPSLLKAADTTALAAVLEFTRDHAIDWRGLEALDMAQALWKVEPNAFVGLHLPTPLPGAVELPQWAFMRLAMEASHAEADPTAWAIRFYNALSLRQIVIIDALREAGKPNPTFLDDHTIRVGDSYRAILLATNTSALATQWTGTVAMDWRQVRSVGSPIAAGRRPSYGVTAFWEGVDRNLLAQGRQGDDRPVTVSLPLWHREAMALLTLRETLTPRLQPTLLIPDLFFERLRERGTWYFLDPNIFPEVRDGTEEGYKKAEAALATRRRQHPYAVQQMSAEQVWKQILQATSKGSPYIVFEGSIQAAAPFPLQAPSSVGLDGVGALPLPLKIEGLASSRWASGAVNMAQALGEDGQPAPAKIQEGITVLLRLLDNLTLLAEGGKPAPYRAVCIGPVGYYEAINQASAHMKNDPELVSEWVVRMAQVWQTLMNQANRDLARERGPAQAWLQEGAEPMGPGSFRRRLKKLRKGQLAGIAVSSETERLMHEGDDESPQAIIPGRFTVCSVWAPFENAARLAGTTPGGIGTLYPVDRVLDQKGHYHHLPTPFLLHHLAQQPHRLERYGAVMAHPEDPSQWPKVLAELSNPDRQAWEQRLQHAALIRPWIEQGVSVTLPVGLPTDMLQQLLPRAWWLGLSTIRFASPLQAASGMDKPENHR